MRKYCDSEIENILINNEISINLGVNDINGKPIKSNSIVGKKGNVFKISYDSKRCCFIMTVLQTTKRSILEVGESYQFEPSQNIEVIEEMN